MKCKFSRSALTIVIAVLLTVGLSLSGAQAESLTGEAAVAGFNADMALSDDCDDCGLDTQPTDWTPCSTACFATGSAVVSTEDAVVALQGERMIGVPSSSWLDRFERPDPHPPKTSS